LKKAAIELSKHVFLIEEFISREIDKGNIDQHSFTDAGGVVAFHAHCHQKALSTPSATVKMLSLPKNYEVRVIPSGCCGMAGSFGYEKRHFDISMKIGELVLFPAIRRQSAETIIAANGTSCRHQIWDGVGKKALHPVEILYAALASK
jgi:Fe-S oxidoreductase